MKANNNNIVQNYDKYVTFNLQKFSGLGAVSIVDRRQERDFFVVVFDGLLGFLRLVDDDCVLYVLLKQLS
jgi:hypothetical protein